MILFFSSGRLGNQIFQYAFIKKIQLYDEKIIVVGFEDLLEVFEIDDIFNFSKRNRIFRGIIYKILVPTFNILSNIRVISQICVDYDIPKGFENFTPRRESISFTQKKGLLKCLRFIKLGYFQSEKFFNPDIVKSLVIRSKYLTAAEKFFKEIPKDANRVFVHIRRGDYKEFKIFGKSTVLPLCYFNSLIDFFQINYPNSFFIFLSDEPEQIEINFASLKNKKVSLNNNQGTDFAIITLCNSGILSTSSFGWWAAYLIKEKGIIFAPKYWLGFNSHIEFPLEGVPTFAKQIEIC